MIVAIWLPLLSAGPTANIFKWDNIADEDAADVIYVKLVGNDMANDRQYAFCAKRIY